MAYKDFTLADLTRITGAKRRSVQLWAEAGALKAAEETERGGSGTHRRFDHDEAVVACILHEFAKQSVAIGQLIDIARSLRFFLTDPKFSADIQRAIANDGVHYLMANMAVTGIEWSSVSEDDMTLDAKFLIFMGQFKEAQASAMTSVLFLNKCLKGMA